MIRSPEIKPGEKLRLALLYVLRYEEVANLENLKRELLDGGVPQAQTQFIDLILQHGGKVFVHLLFLSFVLLPDCACRLVAPLDSMEMAASCQRWLKISSQAWRALKM